MLVEQVSFFIDGRANRRNSFPTLPTTLQKFTAVPAAAGQELFIYGFRRGSWELGEFVFRYDDDYDWFVGA